MVYAPGIGTGYVSVGDYLDSNKDTLAREQGQITQGVGSQIDAAQQAADNVIAADQANYVPDWTTVPGYADTRGMFAGVNNQARALGSRGGVSDYFQKQFGDTRGQGDFDAGLLGYDASGLQSRASGLYDYLDNGLRAVQPPGQAATDPALDTEDRTPPRGSGTYDHPGGTEDAPWDNPNPWGQDGGG